MRAIIVDDEALMIQKFVRLTEDLKDLNIVGRFEDAGEALAYAEANPVEVAFLDVEMPEEDGISLAKKLKELNDSIIVVFVTAYNEYIRDSNEIGGDYYIVKPYTKEVLSIMMEKLRVLSIRQNKEIYIQMFGRFLVKKNGKPVPVTGKAKEILALVATRRGKEISNEEIYTTIWEGRPYNNESMNVYYNALRRLKRTLCNEQIGNLLIPTRRGQTINTEMVDCDYYAWQDKNTDANNHFAGEFLSEYSWGEYILGGIFSEEYEDF